MKGFAVAVVAGHVADQQHQGRGILKSGVHANRRVGSARSPRDHAYTRAARQFSMRLSHEGCAALLAAGDEPDLVPAGVQAIKHSQVTFPRHAECVADALCQQTINKKVAGKL